MSGTDPFFDAWVRDKLLHTEARTPEHLWEKIRKRSRHYVIMERNKYFLLLLLLLGSTAGTGYWIFRPTLQSGLTGEKKAVAPTGATTSGTRTPGLITSSTITPDAITSGTIASGSMSSGSASTPTMTAHEMSSHEMTSPEMTPAMSSDVRANTAMGPGDIKADGGTAYGDRTIENATAATNRPSIDGPTIDAPTSIYNLANASANDNLRDDLQAIAPFPLTPATPRIAAYALAPVAPANLVQVRPANHAYFEAYAGPDHVEHYITSSGHAYNAFVTQLRGAIQSYPSFSLGARIDLPVIRDNWRLQLGLHFAQINERMTYSNFNATKAVTEVSTRSVTQPGGGTMVLRDTSTVLVKGQIFKQSLNAYRMLDIPVLISHTVIKTGQVQVNGSVGALFNVTSWYNGDLLDTTGLPLVIDGKTATQGVGAWKKHIGTSLYGSLSLYDQIFSRVQATFEPYLRYDLSPINRDLSVYKERFVTTGLMLGIRYQLGK